MLCIQAITLAQRCDAQNQNEQVFWTADSLVRYIIQFSNLMIYTFVQDTFRGRVCECPIVQGVKFVGDGYTHCEGTEYFFFR